jgi:hypothetical protein
MRGWVLVAYSLACVAAYHVVSEFHYRECRASWFSALHQSPTCVLVEKGLRALQVAPLAFLAPLLPLPRLLE